MKNAGSTLERVVTRFGLYIEDVARSVVEEVREWLAHLDVRRRELEVELKLTDQDLKLFERDFLRGFESLLSPVLQSIYSRLYQIEAVQEAAADLSGVRRTFPAGTYRLQPQSLFEEEETANVEESNVAMRRIERVA